MWTQDGALLLLLLACCLWSAEAQRQNIWDEPIKFNTKAKDVCTMIITGHGEYTRLRLSCQSRKRSYWCEYIGRPYTCSSYNKHPRHYFLQMSWGLRKLYNACEAPRQIKPHMCRKAIDDSQMVFSSASFTRSSPEASTRTGIRPAPQPARPQPARPQPARPQPARPQPARPQPRPTPTRPNSAREIIRVPPRVKPTLRASPQPATPPEESHAKKMARLYCWRSLHGICSYVIGLFRKN